jgi:hypothetical protein
MHESIRFKPYLDDIATVTVDKSTIDNNLPTVICQLSTGFTMKSTPDHFTDLISGSKQRM